MEFGLCVCGCGRTTPIANKSDKRRGYKKGEHTRFMPGHAARMQAVCVGKGGGVVSQVGIEINEHDLVKLRDLDDDEAARILDNRAMQIENMTRRSFAELGMICLEMRNRSLWARLAHLDSGVAYHSWEDWVTSRLKVSRTTAFAAVKIINATKDNAPIEDLKEMSRQNLAQFAKLSPALQKKPEIVRKAQEQTEQEFVDSIREKHPEQHLEKAPMLNLNFSDPSNRKHFDHAVEVAMWSYEVESREDAIANIVAFFLDGLCDRQGYVKQSNRDAFKMAQKRKTA